MNGRSKVKKGFTLIELVVVIAIIAILVLLALPKLLGYTKDAKITLIRHDVKVAELFADEELSEFGKYPDSWEGIEFFRLQEAAEQNKVYDKRGLVASGDLDDGDYFRMDKIKINSKLPGDFYGNKGGKVYYEDTISGVPDKEPSEKVELDEKGCPVEVGYIPVSLNEIKVVQIGEFEGEKITVEDLDMLNLSGYKKDGQYYVFLENDNIDGFSFVFAETSVLFDLIRGVESADEEAIARIDRSKINIDYPAVEEIVGSKGTLSLPEYKVTYDQSTGEIESCENSKEEEEEEVPKGDSCPLTGFVPVDPNPHFDIVLVPGEMMRSEIDFLVEDVFFRERGELNALYEKDGDLYFYLDLDDEVFAFIKLTHFDKLFLYLTGEEVDWSGIPESEYLINVGEDVLGSASLPEFFPIYKGDLTIEGCHKFGKSPPMACFELINEKIIKYSETEEYFLTDKGNLYIIRAGNPGYKRLIDVNVDNMSTNFKGNNTIIYSKEGQILSIDSDSSGTPPIVIGTGTIKDYYDMHLLTEDGMLYEVIRDPDYGVNHTLELKDTEVERIVRNKNPKEDFDTFAYRKKDKSLMVPAIIYNTPEENFGAISENASFHLFYAYGGDYGRSRRSFFVIDQGKLYSWGINTEGQLGDNSTINKSPAEHSLVNIPSNEKVIDLKEGVYENSSRKDIQTFYALTNKGNLYRWGGDKNKIPRVPTLFKTNVKKILELYVSYNDIKLLVLEENGALTVIDNYERELNSDAKDVFMTENYTVILRNNKSADILRYVYYDEIYNLKNVEEISFLSELRFSPIRMAYKRADGKYYLLDGYNFKSKKITKGEYDKYIYNYSFSNDSPNYTITGDVFEDKICVSSFTNVAPG